MSNRLEMAMVQTIRTLLQQGWFHRRIARELGIHRETVARLVAESKPAKAPTGVAVEAVESKPAKAPTGVAVEAVESKPAKAPTGVQCGDEAISSPSPSAASPLPVVPSSSGSREPTSEEKGVDARTAGVDGGGLCPVSAPHSSTGLEPSVPGSALPEAGMAGVVPTSLVCRAPASEGKGLEESLAAAEVVRSRSACDPFAPAIIVKLEQGLSAQRIYQDLVADQNYSGSYYSVRRFVAHLAQTRPLPFRRLECAPGEEAQVDFGSGVRIHQPDGRKRRSHVLRIVLSYSRKAYSEAVWRQTTEDFIRCLENAFWYFGGVPRRLVLDNLRAAVHKADWFDPELNPKILEFAAYYGIALLPTKPYTPRHKGKVERGVDYVQENGLKGHQFTSLAEENQHLLNWEQGVADTRVHGTTRQQVGKLFREVEKAALLPLPLGRFPFFHEAQRTVHRDGHVEVAKAYYSAPPEYLGRRVWVRWDARVVRLFNQRLEQIDVHVRQEPGRFSTHAQHVPAEKINGVERGAEWLLTKVRALGPQSARWAE